MLVLEASCWQQEAFAQRKKKKSSSKEKITDLSSLKAKPNPREAEYFFTEGQKYFILEDYAKSLVLFRKSLENSPNNAAIYYKIAEVMIKVNDLDKAQFNATKALALDDTNKYYYLLLANIHTQKGDFKEASVVFENLISKIPGTEEYLLELASYYLYQERYDEAITAYNRLAEKYGINEQISQQKQKILLKLNRFDEAVAEARSLVSHFPGEERYIIGLAELYVANNKEEEAIPFLEELLMSNPENARARLILAEIYREKGDNEKSFENLKAAFSDSDMEVKVKIEMLAGIAAQISAEGDKNKAFVKEHAVALGEKLVEIHPEDARAHAVLGDLFVAIGQKESAVLSYLESLKLDDSTFPAWQNLLQLEVQLNKIDDVIKHSETALEIFPNQNTLYYYSGVAHLQKNHFQEAIFALEQGKKLSSSSLELVSVFNGLLGDAYNGNKEYNKSDQAYQAALDFDPDNYGVLNNYSYYLALRKDKLELAKKMSYRVVRANPKNITYLDTYAWVLYHIGDYEEAKKAIERAFEAKDGVSATHYEHYGDILYKMGNVDEAVRQWQIAKGMDASLEFINKKIADRKLYE